MTLSQKPKCPMCTADISNIADIVILDNDNEFKNLHHKNSDDKNSDDKQNSDIEKDKIENFEDIIKNKINNDSRLLVFSEYDASFSQMLQILDDNQISYSKIMGTGAHINNVISKYKEGNIKCLLLNARYFGSGLNLENTTDIIIYHKMSPDLKKQVEGRAQRPGRTCQLKIYELLYKNEI
jgi:SNF2 family DNA or RNA helicase